MKGRELGKKGEDAAAEYLCCHGYRILARNYRVPCGELDIVACQGDTVVFVEVKTRRDNRCGTPGQSVTWRKQQKIIRTARWYLHQYRMEQVPCRFDVMEVCPCPLETWDIRQLRGAFEA